MVLKRVPSLRDSNLSLLYRALPCPATGYCVPLRGTAHPLFASFAIELIFPRQKHLSPPTSPLPPCSAQSPQCSSDTPANCVPSTQSRRTFSDRVRAAGNCGFQIQIRSTRAATVRAPLRAPLHNREIPCVFAARQIPTVSPLRQKQTSPRLHSPGSCSSSSIGSGLP